MHRRPSQGRPRATGASTIFAAFWQPPRPASAQPAGHQAGAAGRRSRAPDEPEVRLARRELRVLRQAGRRRPQHLAHLPAARPSLLSRLAFWHTRFNTCTSWTKERQRSTCTGTAQVRGARAPRSGSAERGGAARARAPPACAPARARRGRAPRAGRPARRAAGPHGTRPRPRSGPRAPCPAAPRPPRTAPARPPRPCCAPAAPPPGALTRGGAAQL